MSEFGAIGHPAAGQFVEMLKAVNFRHRPELAVHGNPVNADFAAYSVVHTIKNGDQSRRSLTHANCAEYKFLWAITCGDFNFSKGCITTIQHSTNLDLTL